MIIPNKIRQNFNKSAQQYDQLTGLHRKIADKIFQRVIKENKPKALLDVGCGTGYLTGMLKKSFPQSQIIGLDFAQGMLEEARLKHEGIEWVLADGHQLPFSDGRFDIIVSNLAYQWAGDLAQAFTEAKRVLVNDGILACTLFGYHTCQELFQSLDEAKTKALGFTRLPDELKVQEALIISGFTDPQVNTEKIRIEFKNMQELMTWLKSIGANNLSREIYFGRETIARAASIYRDKFSYLQGVGATFEVIHVYAKK